MSDYERRSWDPRAGQGIRRHLEHVDMLPPEPMPSALVVRPALRLVDDNVVHVDFTAARRRRVSRYVPTMPSGGAA